MLIDSAEEIATEPVACCGRQDTEVQQPALAECRDKTQQQWRYRDGSGGGHGPKQQRGRGQGSIGLETGLDNPPLDVSK